MDLKPIIQQLQEKLASVEGAIAALEQLLNTGGQERSRRGRKSMGAAERAKVSERMKKYWASQREPKR